MNKKERDKREQFKNDIYNGISSIVDGIESIDTFLSVNDGTVNDLIGGEDIRFLRMLSEHRNTTKRILSSMGDAFEMDRISNSTDSIDKLRQMADDQITAVKEMGLDDMLYSEGGYSPLRMIYERKGNFLYPSTNIKDPEYKKRRDLYREYSNKADEIFRETLEGYYGTKDLPQKTKDKIFGKAWEDGHSAGFCEVRYHYDELADVVLTMVE